MKTIPLTQGKVALVDDEDFDRVTQFKWCAHFDGHNWYALRATGRINGKQKHVNLHQFLLPGHPRVDHKDGDGLNNVRGNIRPATHGQNICNSRKRRGCLSIYKGVTRVRGRWMAQLVTRGKHYFLGYHDDEISAARAYDIAAGKFHGKFAKFNFP